MKQTPNHRKINSLTTLHHVPMFSACSKKDLARIVKVANEATFNAGHLLVEQGQPGSEAYIILKGMATVKRGDKKIANVGAGSIIGELSLLDNGPRTASVLCDTEVDVLIIGKHNFHNIMRDLPSLREKLLVSLALRVRELDKASY